MVDPSRSDRHDEGEGTSAAGEPYHRELEPLLWQAHVKEEVERAAREHRPAPDIYRFAEEYAEHAMRGVEASENEYRRAAERGEKLGAGDVTGYLADAGDIAGG